MNKTKVSYGRLENFILVAPGYVARNEVKGTKIAYAINRILTQCTVIGRDIQDKITAIQVNNALTDPPDDPKGKLVMSPDGNRYEFSREGALNRDVAIRKLAETRDIEIEQFFITLVPTDLNEILLEAFSGFVIEEKTVDRILKEKERWSASSEDSAPGNDAAAAEEITS